MSGISLCIASAAIVAAALLSAIHGDALAYGRGQNNSASVEVADEQCSFFQDRDNDGKGDRRFDAGPDAYLPQHSRVLVDCIFKVKVSEISTLVVVSELHEWEAMVEIEEAPGDTETFWISPARSEVAEIDGSRSVTINLAGYTPSSIKNRGPAGYNHEVQMPERFRMIEARVITKAGENDRLEHNANAASDAFIYTRKLLNEAGPDAFAYSLAGELLDQGYPEIAERVLALNGNSSNGAGWWQWAAMGTWGAVILIAVVAALSVWFFGGDRKKGVDTDQPGRGPRIAPRNIP